MDTTAILNSTGTISIQVALIVGHIIYLSLTMKAVRKEFDEHKVHAEKEHTDLKELMQKEIQKIEEDMGRNDVIFKELQTNMTKVLVSLEFIQTALKDLKKKK